MLRAPPERSLDAELLGDAAQRAAHLGTAALGAGARRAARVGEAAAEHVPGALVRVRVIVIVRVRVRWSRR